MNDDLDSQVSSAVFFKAFIAINLALPLLISAILPVSALGSTVNYALFLLGVTALLILNLWLLKRARRFRVWILAIVLLNILASVFLGYAGFSSLLPDLPFLIGAISNL